MQISKEKKLTEDEKKVFTEEVRKRIGKMRFSLGAKSSMALEYLLIQKATSGKTIQELAPECQRYMHEKFANYMERPGDVFLLQLEMDIEENAEKEKEIQEEVLANGLPIENLYEKFLYELFPYKKEKN